MSITTSRSVGSSFNYQARLTEIQGKLRDFEKKMGVVKSVDLKIGKFGKSPCAQMSKNTIQLPSWFLFKYDDIPARFRVADPNDPRITSPVFLDELSTWMNGKIRESGLSSVCRPTDRGILQFVLMLMRNPDLFERSKDFTLGHELAHLYHAEGKGELHIMEAVQGVVSMGGIIAGAVLLVVALALIPVAHLAVTIGLSALAVTITVGGVLGWMNRPVGPPSPSAVEEEKMADLDSVKILGDSAGGVHFFDTSRMRNLFIRRQNPSMEKTIDAEGNSLSDTVHPKLTERIQYLRNWRPT